MVFVALLATVMTLVFSVRVIYMYRRARFMTAHIQFSADPLIASHADQVQWENGRSFVVNSMCGADNDILMFSFGIFAAWAAVQTVFLMISTVRLYTGRYSAKTVGFAYTGAECRVAGMFNIQLWASAIIAFIAYAIRISNLFPVSPRASFWISLLFPALSSAFAFFATGAETQHAFRFVARMPICWMPPGGGAALTVVKLINFYLLVVAMICCTTVAFQRLRSRVGNESIVVVKRRLLPQVALFAILLVLGVYIDYLHRMSTRFHFAAEISFMLLSNAHGAFAAVLWANSEGVLRALLVPWSGIDTIPSYSPNPFSRAAASAFEREPLVRPPSSNAVASATLLVCE